jgi:hypothetical protein
VPGVQFVDILLGIHNVILGLVPRIFWSFAELLVNDF